MKFVWWFFSSSRIHLEEREASERKSDALLKKLQELFAALSLSIGGDYGQITTASFDKLLTKVTILVEENIVHVFFSSMKSMRKIRH